MRLECHQEGCSSPEGIGLLADLQECGSTEQLEAYSDCLRLAWNHYPHWRDKCISV